MKRGLVFLTLLPFLATGFPGLGNSEPRAGREDQSQNQNQPKAAPKAKPASLTGCVDEQDGHYVLVDERTLNPVASLEADGFPQEGFAKHMGNKVTVRGISSPGSPVPVFKVRSIETVSDTCAPQ